MTPARAPVRSMTRDATRRALVLGTTVAVLTVLLWAGWLATRFALEEWCEGQPGGRGGAPIHSQADVPAQCR